MARQRERLYQVRYREAGVPGWVLVGVPVPLDVAREDAAAARAEGHDPEIVEVEGR